MPNNVTPKIVALYLPQFHPIPENDKWWGKGFTEWTNVGKAKPLFKNHYQPRVPADLGYYDLRLEEVRIQQAEMAKDAGVSAFCYWHYWFGDGKRLLERPITEVLESGKPDFPFCLGWANHTWTSKNWNNVKNFSKDNVLIEQKYPGIEDHINHFYTLLDAFKDERYLKVRNCPLFLIYKPLDVPNVKEFIDLWKRLARENGLDGIHFVGITENFEIKNNSSRKINVNSKDIDNCAAPLYNKVLENGFDAVYSRGMNRAHILSKSFFTYYFYKLLSRKFNLGGIMNRYDYAKIIKHLYVKEDKWKNVYPTIISGWDRTARSGSVSIVWENCTPELFKQNVSNAVDLVKDKDPEDQIIFLQSWNEWAEGNYVEPDLKYGRGFLDAIKSVLSK
jgi:hypothetical protein